MLNVDLTETVALDSANDETPMDVDGSGGEPPCPICGDATCDGGCDHGPEDESDLQAGWPGDGSGTDDLADYNANEADDYRDE